MRLVLVAACLPLLSGFDGARAREVLDGVYDNLYAPDLLAGVELSIDAGTHREAWIRFGFGRKRKGDETRTLVYSGDGDRDAPRVLVLQRSGHSDQVYVVDGRHGKIEPVAAGRYDLPLLRSDFAYADLRAVEADDYRIEVLGSDRIDGEPCRVLRLRPLEGPYDMMLVWISTRRPVIIRTDYFDDRGLWKRYRARVDRIQQRSDYWVAMEDEMLDLRTGRRTRRHIRNLVVGADVPDEVFSLTQLARGRMPSF